MTLPSRDTDLILHRPQRKSRALHRRYGRTVSRSGSCGGWIAIDMANTVGATPSG